MTITRIDGLGNLPANDSPLDNGWAFAEGTIEVAGGKFGGNAYKLTGTQTLSSDRTLVPNKVMGTTWWWKPVDLTGTGNIWTIHHGAATATMIASTSVHVAVRVKADGALELYTSGTLRATSPAGVITAGDFHHIEVRFQWNTSAGWAKVWVDETQIFNFQGDVVWSNLDGAIHIGSLCSTSSIIDDVVSVEDTLSPLLPHRVHDLLPNGNGASTDFTGDYTDVDDALGADDGDTTVTVGTAVDEQQDYTFEDLPNESETTTVHAVKFVALAKKTEAPNKQIATLVTSNVTEAESTQQQLLETYSAISDIYLTDPDTATAWTISGVNAVKAGIKIKV
jgi:hypothetical protein